jgi:hypothetical protein
MVVFKFLGTAEGVVALEPGELVKAKERVAKIPREVRNVFSGRG